MPFQLHAYSESQDEAGAYAAEAAVADQLVTISGDTLYIPPRMNRLIGVAGFPGSTVENSLYLDSPSLKRRALLDVYPLTEGIAATTGQLIQLHPQHPIELDEHEGMECYILSNPAAAEVHSCVIFLADGSIAPLAAGVRIFRVKFTTGITETASAWTNGAITWRQTLPVGRYQVVGAAMWGTSPIAFRLQIPGVAHRPGFVCWSTEGQPGHPLQVMGGLGVWAEFHSLTPPSVDWLASATSGNSQAGFMDLIKIE